MAYQVIKQPNGKYAIFSSFTDTFIAYNMERQDVVDEYVNQAAQRVRESTEKILNDVDARKPAYFQFTMTFDEAYQEHVEHGGPDIRKEMENETQ